MYLAYQLLFNLIIPVYKASRKIKQGFREMHERMNSQMKQPSESDVPNQAAQPDHSDDYIDFEELK